MNKLSSLRMILRIVVLIGLGASFLEVPVALAAANQVLNLPLNEGSGSTTSDTTGNGNNGTLVNSPTWTTGVTGAALSFDGNNDALTTTVSSSLNSINAGITVAAWIYPNALPGGGQSILSRQIDNTIYEQYYLGFDNGKYRWFINTGSGAAPNYSDFNLGDAAPIGQWVHLVGTYDGLNVKLYVNGVLHFTDPHSGTFSAGSTGMTIGANFNDAAHTPEEVFNGKIDDVKVYDNALTASEVALLYQTNGPNQSLLMPLGDSLTHGYVYANDPNNANGGYRRQLWQTIQANGFTTVNFVGSLNDGIAGMDRNHEGHGGYTTTDIAAFVDDRLFTYAPNTILLLLGTNDLILESTPQQTLNNLSALLNQIHAARPTARILVANNPGVRTPHDFEFITPEDVNELNAGMPALVSSRVAQGWNISLVDLYGSAGLDRTSSSTDFSQDGLHFTPAGYNKLAATWYSVLYPDTTPPSVPTGLTATAVSPFQINLSWTASTDNVAVTGYRIFRGGTLFTTVGTVTTYQNTGLTPSTTYSYTVAAIDAAPNQSAQSSPPASATTPAGSDTTPPSVPTGLTATAVSSSQINLSWTASTDNVAVTGYRIFRGGTLFTTVGVVTTYQNTGLSPSTTYSYTVAAIDAVPNQSAQSSPPASATTPTAAALLLNLLLDETSGSTAFDSSGNGNNGTLNNGPSWVAGKTGNALNFNGINQNVVTGSTGLNSASTAITVSAWVWRNAAQTGFRSVVSRQVSGGYFEHYYLGFENGNYRWFVNTSAGYSNAAAGGAALPVNQWVHLVGTYDGANVRLYVNGSLSFTVAKTGTLAPDTTGIAVGENFNEVVPTPGDEAFNGRIDDVRIYSNALSAGDVTQLYLTTGGDATAPSVPTGLTATAVSSSQINLSWTASTDNVAVTGYRIFRGGTLFTTVGVVTTYQNTGLTASTTYSYTVAAIDSIPNQSAQSTPPASATTNASSDTTPPSVPTGLTATAVSPFQINLSWTASTDNVAVTGYRIFRGGTLFTTVGTVTTYQNTGLTPSTTYSYTVAAIDAAPNQSAQSSPPASATTPAGSDTTPPSVPTGLTATAVSSSQINLSWTASTDNVAVTGYRIFRGGTLFTTVGVVTTYQNTGLSPSTTYSYTVAAIDAVPNQSAQSSPPASATTPTAAALLLNLLLDETSGSTAFDSSGNGNNGTLNNGPSWVAGKTGNALNFNGINQNVVTGSTGLNSASTAITVSAWVWRNAAQTGFRSVVSRQVSGGYFEHYYLGFENGNYRWFVNTSAGYSNAAAGGAALPVNQWVHLVGTYDGANVRLYVNGSLSFTVAKTGTLAPDTTGIAVGENFNEVVPTPGDEAFNGRIDDVRIYSNALSAGDVTQLYLTTGGDATAPSVPTGLTATAVSSSQINLSWTASTDNVAVTGYRIFRGGTLLTTVGAVTTYQNTGLTPSTTYSYTVAAIDAAPNQSAQSSPPASATTPAGSDTTPPSVPTGLTATAVSSSQINLSWTASTDNVAVTGYRIFRGGTLFTTVGVVTTYQNTGLSPSTTYSYTVAAIDAVPNQSAQSSPPASATTPTAAALLLNLLLDETSGSTAFDSSGNGNNGTLNNGPSWVAGKTGNALNFNGINQNVVTGSTGLNSASTAITVSAWVWRNAAQTGFRSVVSRQVSGGYFEHYYLGFENGNYRWFVNTSAGYSNAAAGGAALPVNQWVHLVGTYDGANVRLYVNGSLSFTVAKTGTLAPDTTGIAVGENFNEVVPTPGDEAFNGRIDDVRIYSNALSAGDVTQLYLTTGGDATAPSVPTGLTATAVSSSQINLSWTASTDNVAVTGYRIFRGGTLLTTVGAVTTHQDTGLTASTTYSYTVAAIDSIPNQSAQSTPPASATTNASSDTTPPSVPTGLTATAVSSSQINLSWTASTDNVAVTGYRIFRGGTLFTTVGTVTTYQNTGLTPSTTYSYTVAAIDAVPNQSAQSSPPASATTLAPATLLLNLRFNEVSGPTAFDSSGNGNNGTLNNGPAWVAGKSGNALNFNGINQYVLTGATGLNSASTAVTVSAWVWRNAAQTGFRSVVSRQVSGGYFEHYYLGVENGNYRWFVNTSAGYSSVTAGAAVLPVNQWVHLVGTYDGANVRLYVDGSLIFTVPKTGTLAPDTTGVAIGENFNEAVITPGDEAFNGRIDDVRIYSTALSGAEVTQLFQNGGAP